MRPTRAVKHVGESGLAGMWYRFGKSGSLRIEAHAELAGDGTIRLFAFRTPTMARGRIAFCAGSPPKHSAFHSRMCSLVNAGYRTGSRIAVSRAPRGRPFSSAARSGTPRSTCERRSWELRRKCWMPHRSSCRCRPAGCPAPTTTPYRSPRSRASVNASDDHGARPGSWT